MEQEKELSEAERMEVFRVLVSAQDSAMSVAESRQMVCRQFELSDQQVRQIEREGINASWPPLEA